MAILITEGPSLYGYTGARVEMLTIGQSNDMDIWPEVTAMTAEPNERLSNNGYASCGGRVRTPMIGGGGSHHMYFALRQLMWRIEKDAAYVGRGEQGDLFGARPHRRRRFVERHVDDGHGYFGLEILADGRVRIRMRPLGEEGDLGATETEVMLAPETPYQRTYAYMPRLWKAIRKDNKKLKGFRGNHTW